MCTCCKRLLIAFFHHYMQLFNALHALAGFVIVIFGVYMILEEPADISNGIAILGAVIFIAGLIGWFAVSHKWRCMLRVYNVLMTLLCLGQATICVLLVSDEDLVIGNIPEADDERYQHIEDWIKGNVDLFIIVEASLAGVEFLLVIFSCCYSKDIRKQRYSRTQEVSMIEDAPYDHLKEEKEERQKGYDAIRAKWNLPTTS